MVLEKPTGATSAIIAGGDIGTTGSDYYFKVITGDFGFSSPKKDVTGDGDTAPTYENNGYLYGNYTLHGAMIASQAMGLAALIDSTKNPTSAAMTFAWGGTRDLTSKVLVEAIRVAWKRTAAIVGVSLKLCATDSVPSEA